MKVLKFLIISLCTAVTVCFLLTVGLMVYQSVADFLNNDNTQAIARKAKYNSLARVRGMQQTGIETHKGYKSIEMIARYFGFEETPEPIKNKEYRTNREFFEELQGVFYENTVTKYSNLKNSELIDLIYDSLTLENPVIIFHAGKTQDTSEAEENGAGFEMRYSLVMGVDLPNNRITLSDPEGTILRYTLDEFIRSARFEYYETNFFETMAFTFRIYAKNTVFIIEKENRE